MNLRNIIINKKYIFLDRDGVINERVWQGYITKWEDFHFIHGAKEAIVSFSKYFDRVIIVTNQQGIGKGIMSDEDVQYIHAQLKKSIENAGGKIDAIYYCGDLKSKLNNCRKPGVNMALKAKTDFPEICFEKSLMIGDTKSDMEFARKTGMSGILIKTPHMIPEDMASAEYSINSLDDIVKLLN